MYVREVSPKDEGTRLRTVSESDHRTFIFEDHNYAIVRIGEHNQPKHVTIGLEGGVLCFNLKSQTLRVLPWDTMVKQTKVEVEIERLVRYS